jgi:tetratricopeptide (TPR) repeat protein
MSGRPVMRDLKPLVEAMQPELREATLYCALPHWFDRSLGLALITKFTSPSSDSSMVLAELLSMPFVYSHGNGAWQYTGSARAFFMHSLEKRKSDFVQLSQYLVDYLQGQYDHLADTSALNDSLCFESVNDLSWERRQLQWQIAYHWAPLDSKEAMKHLIAASEWAGANSRHLGDHKLIVDVWRSQEKWLGQYRPEGVYLEGRYAYAQRDWPEAEKKFDYVWHFASGNRMVKANAGHLLAVIRRQKGQRRWTESAELILRQSLTICEEEIGLANTDAKWLASRVLNSLGATLIQLGEPARVQESLQLLKRSLKLHEELGDTFGWVQVLNSIGNVLMQPGESQNFSEAERLFREALKIADGAILLRSASMLRASLANLLMRRGRQEHYSEAEALLRQSLQYAEGSRDLQHGALVLDRLALLLMQMGDVSRLPEAESLLRRALELWRQSENPQGQHEALVYLVEILEQTDRVSEARELKEEAAQVLAKSIQG